MAFEKAKVLKAAEKFLSQGKINAAIKEYRQIVENDDDDLTTLNMLGDLCVRAGQNDEAVSCFTRIAEHYREQEFSLKAIAMYKKIERLSPRDVGIASKLAALYATQGLAADARAQYLIIAEVYTKAGKTKQTLEILRKIADLDPHNTEIRLKLGESYLKEELQSEAIAAFLEAGSRLFDTGQFEGALNVYSRVLEFRHADEAALKGMISAHIALGTADEAAELLEKMIGERPNDPELLSMLARTYISAEDAKGAERATSELMARNASNFIRFLEVAQLYLKLDEIDGATRVLGSIAEQLLAGRAENDLIDLLNEVLARNPDHIDALKLLVRVHWWQRDMEKLRSVLERLAEAAQTASLDEDERYALIQLVRLAPGERIYADRLTELGGALDETVEGELVNLENPVTEIPSFENFSFAGTEMETSAEDGQARSEPAGEFEWNAISEQALSDPNASFADLNEALDDSSGRFDFQTDPAETPAPVFEFQVGEPAPSAVVESAGVVDNSRVEAMIRQELESVDFYITQGYADIATDTLDLMERQFGSHPGIDERREKLKASTQADGVVAETAGIDVFDFGEPESATSNQGIGTKEVYSNSDMAFITIAESESETQEKRSSSETAVAPKGKVMDAGLAEIFEEFRLATEDEPIRNEDYETHYNMGTAYKEMDLLDEAIQEFQKAAALSQPDVKTSRYLQCCNMLGHCFMQKGLPRAAVLWFRKGLDTPGHSEEEYKALRYELGSAYQQMGDTKRALDVFTEVYGVDVSYRNVAEKLRELETEKPRKKRPKS